MNKRGLVGAAGALAVLAALAVAAFAFTGHGPATPSAAGPLVAGTEHGMVAEGGRGTVFTDGAEILLLGGDQVAHIVSVRSDGGTQTFRQLGAMIAGPERRLAAITYTPGYPPDAKSFGPLNDAEGAVLKPVDETRKSMGYELLVGYEILDDTVVGYRTGLTVTYRVGDETFVWRSPARLLYCPTSMTSKQCHQVAEADNWGA